MSSIDSNNNPLKFITITSDPQPLRIRYWDTGTGVPLLFLHGWGCDWSIFQPLMKELEDAGRALALDFPGFGESDLPPENWGTENYAVLVEEFIQQKGINPCVLITHSFGGRVAIRLANRNPDLIRGIVFLASAGLKRKISWYRRLRVRTIRTIARGAEKLLPQTLGKKIKQQFYEKIASRDYLSAGKLRPVFVRTVNEDLTHPLRNIQVPTLLIWGSEDRETPPELGRRMQELLPQSRYIELPGFDHFSLLDRGRHQAGFQIKKFIEEL